MCIIGHPSGPRLFSKGNIVMIRKTLNNQMIVSLPFWPGAHGLWAHNGAMALCMLILAAAVV